MTTHDLKTWPEFFQAIGNKSKTFEVRKDDRGFKTGDQLKLWEWDPETKEYTGRYMIALVNYVLDGGRFGIEPDHVVMSIQVKLFKKNQ
jgi:hypothetical protein